MPLQATVLPCGHVCALVYSNVCASLDLTTQAWLGPVCDIPVTHILWRTSSARAYWLLELLRHTSYHSRVDIRHRSGIFVIIGAAVLYRYGLCSNGSCSYGAAAPLRHICYHRRSSTAPAFLPLDGATAYIVMAHIVMAHIDLAI